MKSAEIILSVKDVSKQYRLGEVGTGTLSHDLNRWWQRIRGKSDPYASVGVENDRSSKSNDDYVWALQNIDLDVARGEVIGIIGKNGAGKSTLLKLLSQVTSPSSGSINYNGRLASLLEVGTGFHPELTGRENIYLNGAILGMDREEISRKLDQIIDFAGIAKYVDTPVKRYSSGMKVRLGFAVAAHLEPDILVVDEVLAVGDAEFQRKAIGKMQDVTGDGERTVLFVSHNMSSVRNLCTRGVLLENGKMTFDGPVEETIDRYLKVNAQEGASSQQFEDLDLPIQFKEITVEREIEFESELELNLHLLIRDSKPDYTVGFLLYDTKGNCLTVSTFDELGESLIKSDDVGAVKIKSVFPAQVLKPGTYTLTLSVRTLNGAAIHKVEDEIRFEVRDTKTYRGLKGMYRPVAIVAPPIQWKRLDL